MLASLARNAAGFLRRQGELMWYSDPALVDLKGSKSAAVKFVVSLSCALYYLLAAKCAQLGQTRSMWLYIAVATFSILADGSVFTSFGQRNLQRWVVQFDRWTASCGVGRIVYILLTELFHLQFFHLAFELVVLVFALFFLHQSRLRAAAKQWDWRWASFHTVWHLITCVGGLWVLQREQDAYGIS